MRVAALIRCGELCRSCGSQCRDIVNEASEAEIECPQCSGLGCDNCDGGSFTLTECPRLYVGQELTAAINVAVLGIKGLLPVAGGTLDQSAWYLELMQTLESEQNRIDNERAERQWG